MTRAAAADPLLALLDTEHATLLAALDRAPRDCHDVRTAPDRWCAAEIVEHLARIEGSIAKLLEVRATQPLTASPEELAAARLTPGVVAAVRDRSRRIEAPERVRPSGTMSLAEALDGLSTARARLVAAYRAADAAVLDGAVHPHPLFGPITLRGWVEFAAHHEARHAAQIAELADETPGSAREEMRAE